MNEPDIRMILDVEDDGRGRKSIFKIQEENHEKCGWTPDSKLKQMLPTQLLHLKSK